MPFFNSISVYHQSSERILAEPEIEPATFCSEVIATGFIPLRCFDNGYVGRQPAA